MPFEPEFIDSIYNVVIDPAAWGAVLAGIRSHAAAAAVILQTPTQFRREQAAAVFATDPSSDVDLWRERGVRYGDQCPFTAGMAAAATPDPGRFVAGLENSDWDHTRRTAFWNEHFASLDLGDAASLLLHEPKATDWPILTVMRPRSRGAFASDDLAHLQILAPHLRFATRMLFQTAQEAPPAASYLQALDGMPTACVILRRDGAVAHANPQAARLLERHDLIGLRGRRLVGLQDDDALQRLVARVCGAAGRRGGGQTLLTDGRGASLLVMGIPIGETNPLLDADSSAGAALYLLEPTTPTAEGQMERRLRLAYGLTPTEAEIARDLIGGASAQDIATRRDRSIHTVRAQIKSLLDRVGVRRIAELRAMRRLVM